MTRFFTLLLLLATAFIAKSSDKIVSYGVISDRLASTPEIQDVPVIRPINGGTVIIPIFDESCPEEMKAPFSYACKIVEDLPPCLPLKVKVSCGMFKNMVFSSGFSDCTVNTISLVTARSKENFGNSSKYNNAPMSTIKGVILAELGYNSTVTYLDSVPDVDFLTAEPDIEIVYREQEINSCYFSLDTNTGNKHDFVSMAIRDILIGLGMTSGFSYQLLPKGLNNPSHEMIPFEAFIDKMLGNYGNPSTRLAAATKGELLLRENNKSLKLYAPSIWDGARSLRFFVPQDDCNISKVLSYDFYAGKVYRALHDDYHSFIFRELLGWKANYTTDSGSSSSSSGGSTSLLMPYNGSLDFDGNIHGISYFENPSSQQKVTKAHDYVDNPELRNYIYSFHPFSELSDSDTGTSSISILKKDGTWDNVHRRGVVFHGMPYSMSDWTFHFDESEYARTIDGYLRAKITTKNAKGSGFEYVSKFFVVDYIPQKVKLSYSRFDLSIMPLEPNCNTRIYFSNTEGINRLELDVVYSDQTPININITEIKKGYFDTYIDFLKTAKISATGYNDNGCSVSDSITISAAVEPTDPIEITLYGNYITINSGNGNSADYCYSITPIDFTTSKEVQSGSTSGTIDISALSGGLYILNVTDSNSGASGSFKFKK